LGKDSSQIHQRRSKEKRMNVIPPLIDILENANLGKAGKTLFIDDIPAGIDDALMVRMTSSLPVDTDVPILKPAVQVLKRAKTSDKAINDLYEVIKELHTFNEQTWGDIDVMQCHCVSEPQFIIKDESGRVTYTITFQLYIRWE
jgi:hypothetical protein